MKLNEKYKWILPLIRSAIFGGDCFTVVLAGQQELELSFLLAVVVVVDVELIVHVELEQPMSGSLLETGATGGQYGGAHTLLQRKLWGVATHLLFLFNLLVYFVVLLMWCIFMSIISNNCKWLILLLLNVFVGFLCWFFVVYRMLVSVCLFDV